MNRIWGLGAALILVILLIVVWMESQPQPPPNPQSPDLGDSVTQAMNSCGQTFGFEKADFGGEKALKQCEYDCLKYSDSKAFGECLAACDDKRENFASCFADRTARLMHWPLEKERRRY
jgi:hypothetical protein